MSKALELHCSFSSQMILDVFMQTHADLVLLEVVVSATEAVSNLTVKSGGVPCLQCGTAWHGDARVADLMAWHSNGSRGSSGDRVEGAPLL